MSISVRIWFSLPVIHRLFNIPIMTQPNQGTEPAKVTTEVAGAQNPATQNKQDGNPPAILKADDLLNEFTPKEEPKTQTVVPPEQRDQDRKVREAKFNLQLTANAKKVEKAISEGVDLEDALDGVPQHLQGKIRKIIDGESIEEEVNQNVNPADLVSREVSRQRSLDKAQDLILKAIESNGLNVATADAQASRKSLISNYQRLLQANSPEESAEFALFKAGIASKQVANDAYDNGFRQGNMAVPPPGHPGYSPTGQPTAGQIPTAEQVRNMSFEQLQALDRQVSTQAINSTPMISPTSGQGNPNVR